MNACNASRGEGAASGIRVGGRELWEGGKRQRKKKSKKKGKQ